MIRRNKVHFNDGNIKTLCGIKTLHLYNVTTDIRLVTCNYCKTVHKALRINGENIYGK